MKDLLELQKSLMAKLAITNRQIAEAQAQLDKVKKLKFSQVSTVNSMESDGISDWDELWTIHHNGLDIDLSTTLTERDLDGRKEKLEELEEQELIFIVRDQFENPKQDVKLL